MLRWYSLSHTRHALFIISTTAALRRPYQLRERREEPGRSPGRASMRKRLWGATDGGLPQNLKRHCARQSGMLRLHRHCCCWQPPGAQAVRGAAPRGPPAADAPPPIDHQQMSGLAKQSSKRWGGPRTATRAGGCSARGRCRWPSRGIPYAWGNARPFL